MLLLQFNLSCKMMLFFCRPFIQFCIFALAFWICMTRISDYKHHPGDVAVGMLVGVVWAILVHGYTLELFARPLSFW